jgi:hypothetical protein
MAIAARPDVRGTHHDRALTVYAFDPSVGPRFGNHLVLRIPYEPLRSGPVGRRVAVVDVDHTTGRRYPGVDLDSAPLLLSGGVTPDELDVRFHQQMSYAVASYTIELFQNALGRPVRWPWAGRAGSDDERDKLRVFPHSQEVENAWFDGDGAVHLGYFTALPGSNIAGQRVYSCLAFDIVMHSVTHALLAAIGRAESDTAAEGFAWQEAICDLLPLLHHFTVSDAVLETITRAHGRIHDSTFLPDAVPATSRAAIQAELAVDNPLLQLAPQFGVGVGLGRAIRSALGSPPGSSKLADLKEPHERGAILVAAVFDAMFTVYTQRSRDLLRIADHDASSAELHPDLARRLTREAVRTARRFLVMCVRAIDYCPPGPVAFGDYLRALITVSGELAPQHEPDHRLALIEAFRSRHIPAGDGRPYSEEALRWPWVDLGERVELSFGQSTRDEECANELSLADVLSSHRPAAGLARNRPVQVDPGSVAETQRLTADGRTIREVVAAVRQPVARGRGDPVRATVILDEHDQVRYVIPSATPRSRHRDPLTERTAAALPTERPLAVYAFDPSQGRRFGNVMTVRVPFEPLEPGPVGAQVAVIDYDASNDRYYQAVNLEDPAIVQSGGLEPREDDPRFHQQMVYAVCTETIHRFEFALGRRIRWRWRARGYRNDADPLTGRLRVLPHAFEEANAFYEPATHQDKGFGGLQFGYFRSPSTGETVFTCLSHDVIVHETTHALVDQVRPLLLDDTGPDALAFHEAFADIVALLQHFSYPEALAETVLRTGGRIHAATLEPEVEPGPRGARIHAELAPSNPLVEIAREFGQAIGNRVSLREAIGTPPEPGALDRLTEPHDRGAVLVAAVFDAYFTSYVRRTADLLRLARSGAGVSPWGDLHPDLANRLTREAAKTARHLLTICVRALDYLPPVDATFGGFLRALVTSDGELVPDDPFGYRAAIIDAFRARGIRPDDAAGWAEPALRWPLVDPPLAIEATDGVAAAFRTQGDQIWQWLHGFAAEHAAILGLAHGRPIQVQRFNVQASRRVDPTSGLRQREYLVQFVQQQTEPVDPTDPAAPTFTFRGGTVVVFDAAGNVRHAIARPITDADRLGRERAHRARASLHRAGAAFVTAPAAPVDLARLHRGW